MFNRLKAFFGNRSTPTAQSNETARQELNRIRREELSVSAQMRRGEPVNTFPGIAAGSMAKPMMAHPVIKAGGSAVDGHAKGPDGDYATSMLVGAATGSTLAGYAVGGSLTGGLVGASMHTEPAGHSSPSLSNDSCSDSSSSSSCSSDGGDF